jgi:very-short-patch-repair endonuclease
MHRYLQELRAFGAHFRREVPIGPYVVDFAWLSARIAIEVDGASHDLPGRDEQDAERDRFLRSQGFRIIRIRDSDVIANSNSAFSIIEDAVRPYLSTPPPAASRQPPPHKGEGERALPLKETRHG